MILETVYPTGGWSRAFNYAYHRLRRLPDPPHRIARGIAAGFFVSCSPFFGIHFLFAALVAWAVRGNIFAAMLTTLVGNPVTFPFIGAASLATGNLVLGREAGVKLRELSRAFKEAGNEIWWNVRSLFNAADAHWDGLGQFFDDIFLPYIVGGAVNGAVVAVLVYLAAHPLIDAYQRRRSRAVQQRLKKRLKPSGGALAD